MLLILPREQMVVNSPHSLCSRRTQSSIRRSILVLIEFNSSRTPGLVPDNKCSPSVPIEFNSGPAARLAGNDKEAHPWKRAIKW